MSMIYTTYRLSVSNGRSDLGFTQGDIGIHQQDVTDGVTANGTRFGALIHCTQLVRLQARLHQALQRLQIHKITIIIEYTQNHHYYWITVQ